ncbi:unnamed protein product [Sympodiomycopsis kandeliae]
MIASFGSKTSRGAASAARQAQRSVVGTSSHSFASSSSSGCPSSAASAQSHRVSKRPSLDRRYYSQSAVRCYPPPRPYRNFEDDLGSRSRFGNNRPNRSILDDLDEYNTSSRNNTSKGKNAISNPRNDEIRSPLVRLVNIETGRLEPEPVSPQSILSKIDRRRYNLSQVTSEEELYKNRIRDPNFTPIVKLIDKQVETDKRKQKKAEAKKPSEIYKGAPFEVQLTWQTTQHDLGHKFKQAKKFLNKKGPGAKVKVSIVTKSGKKWTSGDQSEKDAFVQQVENCVLEGQEREASAAEEGEEAKGASSSSSAKSSKSESLEGSDSVKIRRNGDITWEGGTVKVKADIEYIAYK